MARDNKKEIILETAVNLFYERGFAATSIRDIVRTVGVANATLYVHFKDKDELLYAIVERVGDTLLGVITKAIETNDDPVACLRAMIGAQVCLIRDIRKEIKIYVEEQYQLSPDLKSKMRQHARKVYDLYYDKVMELKTLGLLRDVDPTVVTFSVFALTNWPNRWYIEDGRLSIEEIADRILKVFFSGILKSGADQTSATA